MSMSRTTSSTRALLAGFLLICTCAGWSGAFAQGGGGGWPDEYNRRMNGHSKGNNLMHVQTPTLLLEHQL
ncbi:MAG: hypothetical protein CMJ84_18130 [Planctomycetes bacterium]|jgi:hypothetical protein|nr:hypothetical protein [Planctomycetota bacterium]